ncbi:hypothetical protein M7I_5082 [Glarea lozoyensis 74030]|uniref:Uncharacterized protein n=1 Tax=Glarea lozoyensis (strain ATCC 74030 / MF5533) TaxID=1104152 RepID=H0EQX3_GLAL7|nr:hypothetical protein M7I_5082 [Glarea lozoyensis 74030]
MKFFSIITAALLPLVAISSPLNAVRDFEAEAAAKALAVKTSNNAHKVRDLDAEAAGLIKRGTKYCDIVHVSTEVDCLLLEGVAGRHMIDLMVAVIRWLNSLKAVFSTRMRTMLHVLSLIGSHFDEHWYDKFVDVTPDSSPEMQQIGKSMEIFSKFPVRMLRIKDLAAHDRTLLCPVI